jgi:hypothetical protein
LASAVAAEPVGHVRLGDAATASALRTALGRAARRLDTPSCRRVLTEFQDGSGQTLQSVLDGAGQSPAGHMAGLFFYDGSDMPQCRVPGTLAFTTRGSRVVLVCPAQFRSLERRDERQIDVVIIHETLHTLGLGENPPTPQHISQRVFSRCVANASTPRER